MTNASIPDVRLRFRTAQLAPFFPLLQQGFYVPIQHIQSIQGILCEVYGLDLDLVRNRIQTLFLNGKPVDDIGKALVKNGDTLALSAAMPGLVGATMRSGGVLACFRNTITYRESTATTPYQKDLLSIKLFNLLIEELGPCFLRQGVLISTDEMKDLNQRFSENSWPDLTSAELNQQVMDPSQLSLMAWPEGHSLVRLQVAFEGVETTADA